jgi:hypothetical protein
MAYCIGITEQELLDESILLILQYIEYMFIGDNIGGRKPFERSGHK